jgi:hypothetical protein
MQQWMQEEHPIMRKVQYEEYANLFQTKTIIYWLFKKIYSPLSAVIIISPLG